MHANARLTVWARREIARRHLAGVTHAEIARQMQVSRDTVGKWWRRYLADPDGPWFQDRSSRPLSCPHQTPPEVEAAIIEQRRGHRLGPARIGYRLGVPSSTVWNVLARHGMNRLSWFDRPTGGRVRRYEKDRPGELVHIDTKQVARIPDGGGWRVFGPEDHLRRDRSRKPGAGYEHVHSAVDDYSRIAYVETLPDLKAETCVGFWKRAEAFFADHGITIEAVMTDNGSAYRSGAFAAALDNTNHLFTRPYRPQTNGKVERFNRTLADEWAYARIYTSNSERADALQDWIHIYNHHRGHTAIGGPPISRVDNLLGSYT
ncbi:MAG: IS481 family transposase [Acidimicrobiia bacterium]